MASFSETFAWAITLGAALVGILFALLQCFLVWRVRVPDEPDSNVRVSNESGTDRDNIRLVEENQLEGASQSCAQIQDVISVGVTSFLFTQYKYLGVFMVISSVTIFLLLGSVKNFSTKGEPCTYNTENICKPALANAISSTIAFLVGALTSAMSGFLSMKFAKHANSRVTAESRRGIGQTFILVFRSGVMMGFLFAVNSLLVLYGSIFFFGLYYGDDWEGLYQSIIGYSLGGSFVALFGRLGGGIYSKSANVGAYLVRFEQSIPEDDPRNPTVIVGPVGDSVRDIVGMFSDLSGSYTESSCAALFLASISSFGIKYDYTAMSYPLMVSSMGILFCFMVLLYATQWFEIYNINDIEPTLKRQFIMSTVMVTIGICMITFLTLPPEFSLFNFGTVKVVKNWHLFLCVAIGLWAGLAIGYTTVYYTSNAYGPVQDVADSCRTGAATNLIVGLALGYKYAFIPMLVIVIVTYVSFRLAAVYGIAVAASGMLSTIATHLAIDAYSPMIDNAKCIADMARLGHMIHKRIDALDAAGNTPTAIGKGFAIGSAAIVSIALFGAFVSRAGIQTVDVLTPKGFIGLIVGAMFPYCLSAMTLKGVVVTALKMVGEVHRQFSTIPGLMEGTTKPDYTACVQISIDTSLREMIPPGALVMLTPVIVGTLFGVETLTGFLVGSFISGVPLAISASITGGAWDNAKKFIEAGASERAIALGPRGSDAHRAAVIGDIVGGPLEDTLGPSLNALIKFMAVESLVFAPFFVAHGGLLFKFL